MIIKYSYFKDGYHQKEVSFEVEAMLMEEEKCIASGWNAMQGTIIGDCNYNRDSYSREKELAFNPLTDQKTTSKYVKHEHERASLYNHIDQLKGKEKAVNAEKSLVQLAFYKVKGAFMAVIQTMLRNYNLVARKNLKNHTEVHLTFLNIKEINKAVKEHTVTVNAKYSLHPHVDALLSERAHNHGRNR